MKIYENFDWSFNDFKYLHFNKFRYFKSVNYLHFINFLFICENLQGDIRIDIIFSIIRYNFGLRFYYLGKRFMYFKGPYLCYFKLFGKRYWEI